MSAKSRKLPMNIFSSKTSTSRQNRQRSSVVFCVFGRVEVIPHLPSTFRASHCSVLTGNGQRVRDNPQHRCGPASSLGSQSYHRVDSRRASRWNKTRCRGYQGQQSGDGEINGGIECVHLKQNVCQRGRADDSKKNCGGTAAQKKTDGQLPCTLTHHHPKNFCGICP